MMFDSITNFEINTVDIWDYEYRTFKSDVDQNEYMPQLMLELEELIYSTYLSHLKITDSLKHRVEPFVCEDQVEDKAYYLRHVKMLISQKTLKEKIRNEFFEILHIDTNCLFSYRQNIEIDRKNKYYLQWFRLKLKQFNNDLQSVNSFLEHQFKKHYNSDQRIFIKFLDEISRFYNSSHFSVDVLREVDSYIKAHRTKVEQLQPITLRTNFQLKALIDSPEYFRTTDKGYILAEIFKDLKDCRFLQDTDRITSFQKLIGDIKYRKEPKLNWIGYPVELKWLTEFLAANGKFEKIEGIEKWKITAASFRIKEKNTMVEIEAHTKISEAFSTNKAQKNKLNEILKKFEMI